MTTVISIKVATVTAARTFANDAKTVEVLRLYAERRGCDPAATNPEKLQFIVDQLVEEIINGGRAQFLIEKERDQVAASQLIGLE